MNNPRRIQRHLVKALAAGALLAAAALPMAIATAAGAAGTGSILFGLGAATPSVAYFGPGATGKFTITDTADPFAGNGGTVTVSTNAPNVAFTTTTGTSGSDISTSSITGTYTSTTATTPGTYNITVTDSAGTESYSDIFTVNPAPTVTSISPTTAADTPTTTTLGSGTEVIATVTGSGFIGASGALAGAKVTSTVDGTQLYVASETTTGTEATPSSTATVTFWLQNDVTKGAATLGTYNITLENADGGTVTANAIFTVTGDEVSNVSPSSVPGTASVAYPITINGGGFQTGATVSLDASGVTTTCLNGALSAVTLVSPSEFTATLTTSSTATTSPAVCDLVVSNSATGDNGASFDLAGAIGFDGPSSVAPTITASNLTTGTALTAGAPSSTIVLTGTGFGTYNGTLSAIDPSGATTNATITGAVANGAGTSLTANVFAGNTGTHTGVAGDYTASINGGTLADAFAVAGPAITTLAPTALAKGAPIGTTVAITGTGFTNTTAGTVTNGSSDTLAGNFEYVSPTAVNFVVTTPPSVAGAVDSLAVSAVDAYGYSVSSASSNLTIDGTPAVTSLTYVTGTTGIGVGATGQKLIINGSGFEQGATVGTFVNGSGTADANVTATVTTVTPSQITATIAVKSGDTNTIVGYTVTNPDGGSAKVLAIAPLGIALDAAPTITAVSPVTATASATNAFTITGTGFETGATVTLSSDGTCGTPSAITATSVTVSCTLGAAGASAVTLSVVNPDGGTATSGTILAAKTGTTTSTFHVTGAHGTAIAGKTVTMTISGTGFYGQPKITSTAVGTKVGVSKDSGKVLTIRVTTKAGIRGEHTFTIRLANGKTGKANYAVKA